MNIKKKNIDEIIDGNGELIGSNGIPEIGGANAETHANGTTDTNAKIGTQPFRYDMLGRFGFSMMPFMEGEDKNEGQANFENDLFDLMHQRYIDILSHYFRNPKRVKPDYRKFVTEKGTDEETAKHDKEYAEKIIELIEKHFSKEFEKLDEAFRENLSEGKVIEEKFVDRKEDEMTTKNDGGDIKEKKLEKIAGLINKLKQKDIDKLINLLEIRNG